MGCDSGGGEEEDQTYSFTTQLTASPDTLQVLCTRVAITDGVQESRTIEGQPPLAFEAIEAQALSVNCSHFGESGSITLTLFADGEAVRETSASGMAASVGITWPTSWPTGQ